MILSGISIKRELAVFDFPKLPEHRLSLQKLLVSGLKTFILKVK